MQRWMYRAGWTIVLIIPLAFFIEAYMIQDVPHLRAWKIAVAVVGLALILIGRNRDDVLKHHVAQ